MKLDRPICFFDVESDSVDPVKGKIIEIAACRLGHPDHLPGPISVTSIRFNPGRPIPPEATAVHKITDEDVRRCPKFSADAICPILDLMKGCDLGGYNLRRFDLVILDEELRRVNARLDLKGVNIIDCYAIFAKKDPRTLSDAVRLYCGKEHKDAHGAAADAFATLQVFEGQIKAYADLDAMSVKELASFARMGELDFMDLAGKIYRDSEGCARYAFGKHKDCRVRDESGYAYWMLEKDFAENTKDVLRDELDIVFHPTMRDPDVPF